ncbi:hypothetical protein [Devosia nitrariae]|uniref:Uncharacterized protein n=1 Tax=Devosia nitrariae TaxID=2071872 RepID=A0ABQ5W353_9HYPH|nr:hypothetical protein [Devosia nitrariae]GLQ54085.1 hypothetical protein GCM10010862_13440 [Devosia nitrariae]
MAVLHETHVPVTRAEVPWALTQGVIGGIIAGIVFAAFEMIASAAMMGPEAFFMPLRMIGAIALGPAALEPTYNLLGVGLAGVIVHVVLAVIYGAVFALVFGGLRSPAVDISVGGAYGLGLWLVNFYVIAPTMFPWFTEANPMIQFIAHTFFFGAVLGWYMWSARHRAEEVE